jgi:ubiquinone/menaquinone biosynthesis C-methylase UbiE
MNTNTAEFVELKQRLKKTWMSGDYAIFATYLEEGAMDFLSFCKISPGVKVLDIACGAGQTALPLARNGNLVTGIDIAANLIETAKMRAQEESLDICFDEGDAEELPYQDSSFDLVLSLIGAMFAPRPDRVAFEMTRVCRPGGRIVMGNWTPAGFIGEMFKTMGTHLPPSGFPSPTLWGDEDVVTERLKPYVSDVQFTKRLYPLKYPFSPAEVVEFFREYYGPTNRAFVSLDETKQAALRKDLTELWERHNQATDGTTFVNPEYLVIQAIRSAQVIV